MLKYVMNLVYFILAILLFSGSYYVNKNAICNTEKISFESETMKEKFVEGIFKIIGFGLKSFINLMCINIRPYMIIAVGIFFSIVSDYIGISIFILYTVICGRSILISEIYLLIIIIALGIVKIYLKHN